MQAPKQTNNESDNVPAVGEIPSLEEVVLQFRENIVIQPNIQSNPTEQKELGMRLIYDIPETIDGIRRENFHKFISEKKFARILIDVDVAKVAFDRLLDVRGKMPFGLLLEWIDGNVYVVDTNSVPHESTKEDFSDAICDAFSRNYRNEIPYKKMGSPVLDVGGEKGYEPDFSYITKRKYLREEYAKDRIRHFTLLGEIAYSEELDHLQYKSLDYLRGTDVDIVLAINIPIGTVPLSKDNLPKFVELYCYYRDEFEMFEAAHVGQNVKFIPNQIKLYFDRRETFSLRVDHLERKIHRERIQEVTCGLEMLPIEIYLDSLDCFTEEMVE